MTADVDKAMIWTSKIFPEAILLSMPHLMGLKELLHCNMTAQQTSEAGQGRGYSPHLNSLGLLDELLPLLERLRVILPRLLLLLLCSLISVVLAWFLLPADARRASPR